MIKCKTCGAMPNTAEFYKSIGTYCKVHWRERVIANRTAKIDHYREYDRARGFRGGPDHVAKYKAKFPKRRAAQVALGNAVRAGRVIPWPICALPECNDKPEAHHADYDQPLLVVWLCSAHHKQAHALMRHYKEAA